MSGSRVHSVSLLYKSLYDDDDIIIIGKKKWRLLVTVVRYIPVHTRYGAYIIHEVQCIYVYIT